MVVYYHCSSTPNLRMPSMLPIYLLTKSGNTDDFKEALDLLDATLSLYRLDNDVYNLGEFNADLVTEGGPRACTPVNEQGRILLRYLSRWKYLLYNLHLSPSQSTFTNSLPYLPKCVVAEEDPTNISVPPNLGADRTLSSVTGNIKLRKVSKYTSV